ncbi:Rrf2 family transcriptional regulator [uncultured Abyssibacter sp.]|uniref:Rrf2 family transcriptional regulator n=1 Tax=uncultured Abyssibacter sp. TaxID=2320202 RepID=UPI0032B15FB8
MKLTTRGRYAVMAMVDLAEHGGEDPVCIGDIAQRQNLSVAYLEQLFAALRRAELVSARRGRCGGYALTRTADQISVAAVMAALDENMDATRCGGEAACTGTGERCRTHGLWTALSAHMHDFLAGISLDDVVAGRLDVREAVVTFAA